MTAAILAGGENRRMPYLKGFLAVEGRTIIERSRDVLRKVFDRVVISTNSPESYFRFGLPLIGDVKRKSGPMTGILSVLLATGEDSVFVAACDMPFLSEELLRYMRTLFEDQRARSKRGLDAAVPVFAGKTEPLLGIYTRNAVKVMEEMLKDGNMSLQAMLSNIEVLYIDEEAVMARDPLGKSFVNINTMEDYKKIGGALSLV
ncbi:MAG: molybdenum cofactor guanylyltransferase [Thermodesulfovibrionales bacterium]